MGLILRPYQSTAINAARANFAEGIRRQMVYSPTGSGKTEIAIALIAAAVAKGTRFDKQSAFSQLLYLADERGYSDGWAKHKYHILFGVWPRGLSQLHEPTSKEMRDWAKSQAIRYAKAQEARHAA